MVKVAIAKHIVSVPATKPIIIFSFNGTQKAYIDEHGNYIKVQQ